MVKSQASCLRSSLSLKKGQYRGVSERMRVDPGRSGRNSAQRYVEADKGWGSQCGLEIEVLGAINDSFRGSDKGSFRQYGFLQNEGR